MINHVSKINIIKKWEITNNSVVNEVGVRSNNKCKNNDKEGTWMS